MLFSPWLRSLKFSSRLTRITRHRKRRSIPLFAIESLEERVLLSADFGFVVGMGGTGDDVTTNVVTDAAGNSYVTGYFQRTVNFDDEASLVSAGGYDAFVAKYDSSGNLAWAKRLGGTGDDLGFGIAIDSIGNIHVSGGFSGTANFGTFNLTSLGQNDDPVCEIPICKDAFVAQLNNSGTVVWAAQLGGSGDDFSQSVTVDGSGNVYSVGHFDDFSDADFDPGEDFFNPVINGGGGANDVFISKLDSAGNFVWALGFGGSGDDHGRAITSDTAGNFYVGGDFRSSTVDFDPAPSINNFKSSAGSYDAYVQKFDSAGNLLWVATMGSSSLDGTSDIAIDSAGNVIAVGHFRGTMDFDPGPLTENIPLVAGSPGDGFVLKLDNAGDFVWAKSVGSTGFDSIQGVVIDNADNVWMTGSFADTADFDPGAGVFDLTSASAAPFADMFVWQLDANGDFVDALSIGGTDTDFGSAIALDNSNVLIAGGYRGTVDFDPGSATQNRTIVGGLHDGFLLKLVQNQSPVGDAGGSYTVAEGGSATLAGSGSDPDADPLTFAWDLDNNGTFETPGQNPTFSAAGRDGPGSQTVVLQVCDDKGACATFTATVNITNVAPSASVTGPIDGLRGDTLSFTLGASDPSPADQAAGFTYQIDWDGDGTVDQSVAGPTGTLVSHVFNQAGSFTVRVTATDKDGGTSAVATHAITVIQPVGIDIKPGSDPNSINLGSKGTIPVAIFSTATFDATTIDPTTVTLADAAVKVRGKGTPMASTQDVNGDDLLDLVVHVETEGLELTETDNQAELLGQTFDGVSIQGFDTIRVVAALHVAGGAAEGVFVGNGLTHATLNPVVEQSLAYWTAAGVESHRLDALTQLDVQIADLSGSLLGVAAMNIVWIDRDAAGYGWSMGVESRGLRVEGGGVDLFSVVTHEFGHVLGFRHDEMGATLGAGVRQLASSRFSAGLGADFGFGSLRSPGLRAGFDTFSPGSFTTYTTHQDDSIWTTTILEEPFETLLLLFDHKRLLRIADGDDDKSDLTAKAAGLLFRRPSEAEEFDHLFAEFEEGLAEAI